jgi:hypothetical protein
MLDGLEYSRYLSICQHSNQLKIKNVGIADAIFTYTESRLFVEVKKKMQKLHRFRRIG